MPAALTLGAVGVYGVTIQAVLAFAATVALLGPARCASRVDPMAVLRDE